MATIEELRHAFTWQWNQAQSVGIPDDNESNMIEAMRYIWTWNPEEAFRRIDLGQEHNDTARGGIRDAWADNDHIVFFELVMTSADTTNADLEAIKSWERMEQFTGGAMSEAADILRTNDPTAGVGAMSVLLYSFAGHLIPDWQNRMNILRATYRENRQGVIDWVLSYK